MIRLAFFFYLCFFCLPLAIADQPPNIVYIISDDQAWTDYGFMQHPHIRTPHLDKLAHNSVVFERGYVPTALCRPSLATLATGHYAHRHRITGNDPSPSFRQQGPQTFDQQRNKLIGFLDQLDTLPQLLAERGYLSHQSGKWWEGSFQNGGFTHGMTRGFPRPGGRHGDDGLTIGRQGLEPIETFVDHAVAQQKPFFLWYGVFLPHTPHNPPQRILDRYQQADIPLSYAKYYANCEWFDETCGQLIEMLEERNLRDNTLIVYVTDNGWVTRPDKSAYALRSKQSPYEGGVRTPIMFSWPAGGLKPVRRSEPISSIDLFPTALAAAGAPVPDGLPGLNLLEPLKENRPIKRKGLFGEGFAHDVTDLENPEATLLYRWRIEGKWKLILTYDGEVGRHAKSHPRTEKRPQLFDLDADPHEKNNLAKEHPEVVQQLTSQIEGWWPVTERQVLTTP